MHSLKLPLYILAGLSVALAATWYVLVWTGNREPSVVLEDVRDVARQVLGGNFSEARNQARILANAAEDPETQVAARAVAGFASSLTGEDGYIEAVRLAKEDFTAPVSAETKASAVNRVIEAMMVSRDNEIIDSVFTGDPFERYRAPNDFAASVVNLAQLSVSLYPTSVATWYVALADSAPLTNFGKKFTLTDEERAQHAESLLQTIHSAEELYEVERTSRQGSSLVEFDPARQLYLQGVYYGIVARVKPEYLDEAEAAHRGLVTYFEETRGADGKPLAPVEMRLPYNYVDHAILLSYVGGKSRHEDIRTLLKSMMSLVAGNPQLHENGYVARLKNTIQKPDSRAYKNFVRLAKIDPEFKKFLEGYGMKFE